MKVAVTGASGLIGKALVRNLLVSGHEVRALVRSPDQFYELPPENVFAWSDSEEAPQAALEGVDAIVHLAGESIAGGRWTEEQKTRIRNSRVRGTLNLTSSLEKISPAHRPQVLIAASAVGYYGDTGDSNVDESSPRGQGFLAELCEAWENAADTAQNFGMRVVHLRTGVVLSKEGGALEKMGPATLGNGQQWMSWIHIDDVLQFILNALEKTNCSGPYNLTSPHPVTNREFTQVLSDVRQYPVVVSAPQFALKLILGEMSQIILESQKVLPQRLLDLGFQFRHADLKKALLDLFGNDGYLVGYLCKDQFVPQSRKTLFGFFSKAENLEILTPPWLNFKIEKKSTDEIQKGTLIDYSLKIHGAPVSWKTLISEWDPENSFVDEQLKGPYSKWRHLHRFFEVPGGTLLRDEVTYKIPGHVLGKMALSPWIRNDVNQIFSYRRKKIRELQQQGLLK